MKMVDTESTYPILKRPTPLRDILRGTTAKEYLATLGKTASMPLDPPKEKKTQS